AAVLHCHHHVVCHAAAAVEHRRGADRGYRVRRASVRRKRASTRCTDPREHRNGGNDGKGGPHQSFPLFPPFRCSRGGRLTEESCSGASCRARNANVSVQLSCPAGVSSSTPNECPPGGS